MGCFISHTKTDEDCPICFNLLIGEKNKEYYILKCRHKFCSSCIIELLNRNYKCPFCRGSIKNEIIISEYITHMS